MDYLATNRKTWDTRTDQHIGSSFYDVKGWLAGNTSLNSIELEILGDIKGKKVLHLMCHFGMDTLSMARMGAEVTGLDLSPRAIEEANKLAYKAGLEATFVNGDVYSAPDLIDEKFDIVFMSYGTIGWLPDIRQWGRVVVDFLKPGGRFVFAEFHPALWMLDEEYQFVKYRYFTGSDPIIDTEGTYTDVKEEKLQTMVSWNHGLADVINALHDQQPRAEHEDPRASAGLSLKHFEEYDYSPYPIFGEKEAVLAPGQWGIKGMERKLPLVYSLVMCKAS